MRGGREMREGMSTIAVEFRGRRAPEDTRPVVLPSFGAELPPLERAQTFGYARTLFIRN